MFHVRLPRTALFHMVDSGQVEHHYHSMSYGVYHFGPVIALREVLEPDVETLMRFMRRTKAPRISVGL